MAHAPVAQPRPEQHSEDAPQLDPACLHGGGRQLPPLHSRPVQQSPLVAQPAPEAEHPARGAHLPSAPQLLVQHCEPALQTSPSGRHLRLHALFSQVKPEQQSPEFLQRPSSSGLHAQLPLTQP